MKDLSDFFKLIQEEKKKQEKELYSILGEDFSTDKFVDDLFSLVKEEVKKEKVSENNTQKKVISEKKIKKSDKPKEGESRNPETDTRTIEKYPNVREFGEETLIEKSLGLLSEPSNTKQVNDPITPLDQKFVTLDQLNKHYNTFISRIQQQLSTLGGGGETNLTYMDVPITSVTSSSYTITPQDYYIGVNYAGAVTITLPYADREGKMFVVKDELGEASKGTNRYITILPSGSDLIDGRDRAILAFDYGSLTFIWKGNSWRVI